jgi:hypothetical protein
LEKQNGSNKTWIWDKELVEKYFKSAQYNLERCGPYANTACIESVEKYEGVAIKGKVGMVVGTQNPWLEGGLLAHGAAKIITLEYNPIVSHHPALTAYTPVQMAHLFEKGRGRDKDKDKSQLLVDFVFSYSSLEHDGLGRYGDPISPFADLESIARIHCLLKEGGYLFLGMPVGYDFVAFNGHRVYGKHRMSLILAMGWEPVDLLGSYFNVKKDEKFLGDYRNQPVWVLKKKSF